MPRAVTPSTGANCPRRIASCSPGSSRSNSGALPNPPPMNEDFLDLLRAFSDADVRFLIVGAYALAHHGRPRATGDLDVWVQPDDANARRVMMALDAFGAPLTEIRAQ